MSATSVAATTRLVNPLTGLRPFYESEQHLFFGREGQIDTMINKLWPPALFAVHDAIGLRRSFVDFKLYVKNQAKWSQITD